MIPSQSKHQWKITTAEKFVTVARVDAVNPGQTGWIIVNNDSLPAANAEGTFHAVDDMCTHEDSPL